MHAPPDHCGWSLVDERECVRLPAGALGRIAQIATDVTARVRGTTMPAMAAVTVMGRCCVDTRGRDRQTQDHERHGEPETTFHDRLLLPRTDSTSPVLCHHCH